MAAATSAMPCPPPPSVTASAATIAMTYSPEEALRAAASTAQPAKHRPAKLGTPLSATYPSLQSPRTSPGFAIKREDSSTSSSAHSYTPLTPPSAYLDFLKAMSPAITSPLGTGASAHFSFTAGPQSARTPSCGAWPSTASSDKFPQPPASARPTLSTFPSTGSTGSNASNNTIRSTTSAPETTAPKPSTTPPQAPMGAASSPVYPYPPPPPSRQSSSSSVASAPPSAHPSGPGQKPFRRPSVLIPESPTILSPGIRSPVSARDINSPAPFSAAPYSATPFSAGGNGKSSPVTVRQVVTRTVIYSSNPKSATHPTETIKEIKSEPRHTPPPQVLVGDAPRGKRRRVE